MVCGGCRVKHFLFLFRSNQQPPPSPGIICIFLFRSERSPSAALVSIAKPHVTDDPPIWRKNPPPWGVSVHILSRVTYSSKIKSSALAMCAMGELSGGALWRALRESSLGELSGELPGRALLGELGSSLGELSGGALWESSLGSSLGELSGEHSGSFLSLT